MARKVALGARDVAILALLLERRVETLDYLHETAFTGLSRKRALNRLGDLARAGYLERLSVPLYGGDGRLESVYRLGPKAKTALVLRSAHGAEAFRGRRFNPTLRASSIDHQIITNRVGDWLDAQLRPEHLLTPAGPGDAHRHRPDGTYTAAQADAQGRATVFLEVDLGHYSRERILGKVKAFLDSSEARSILIVSPDRARSRQVSQWVRDVYGEEIIGRVQPLTFEQVRDRRFIRPGTEPAPRATDDQEAA